MAEESFYRGTVGLALLLVALGKPCCLSAQTLGSLDPNFPPGSGADVIVYSVVLQPDGKPLVGGNFSFLNGVFRGGVARLNSDGSVDMSFQNGLTGVGGAWVDAFAIQPDGKIIIGGSFHSLNGVDNVNCVARLNSDGSTDSTFLNNSANMPGADSQVKSLLLQANGKVVIGGYFASVNDTPRAALARLNSDGSLDPTFQDSLTNAFVSALAGQPDGKLLVAGNFQAGGSTAYYGIVRLNTNGAVDTTFNTPLDPAGLINAMARQPDGRVVIGGNFASVDGQIRTNIARLNPDR